MSFILSMVWKNLLRYRRRTLITAAAIAVALAMYIWIDASMFFSIFPVSKALKRN
jgi:hypothetical protein